VNQALALDSVTFVRGPFRVIDDHNLSADHRTRVILFTSPLGLTQPDPLLTVQAAGFNLPVESVGSLSGTGMEGSFIIVRLPDGLPSGGLPMAFTLRGVMSNTTVLSISP
jgi:hypothetical protein